MPLRITRLRLVYLGSALVGLLLVGALAWRGLAPKHDDDDDEAVNAPQRLVQDKGQTAIDVDEATAQQSDIKSAPLASADEQPSAQAYGSVLDPQTLLADAGAFDTAAAQSRAAQAKARESQQIFERARTLNADDQNVSRAQLQSAQSSFEVDQASLSSARVQQQLAQARLLQDFGPVLAHWIESRDARVTRLTEVRDVLVLATLPSGVRWKEPVTDVVAQTSEAQQVSLNFISAAPRSDAKIQGRSYFFVAHADTGLLPGMTLTLRATAEDRAAMSVVPQSAVVWTEGRSWVYEPVATHRYQRRALDTLGQTATGDFLARTEGAPSALVVRGAQTLLSEEFRGFVGTEE